MLLLAIGLGLGIYYITSHRIPELYKRYIQPIEDNTLQIDDLETSQAQELEIVNEPLAFLQSQMTNLQIQDDNDKKNHCKPRISTQHSLKHSSNSRCCLSHPATTIRRIEDIYTDTQEFQTSLELLYETVTADNQKVDAIDTDAQSTKRLLILIPKKYQAILIIFIYPPAEKIKIRYYWDKGLSLILKACPLNPALS